MALRMSGVSGELRKGYRVVAQLGAWSMSENGRVEAEPVEVNSFLLEQTVTGRFALWLRLNKRAWVWNDAEVVDGGRPFIVRVNGSPAVRDV